MRTKLILLTSCLLFMSNTPKTNKPEIFSQLGHSSWVSSVSFSPDGKRIISGSRDGTTRLWNVETGKETAQFVSFDDGEWEATTPGGIAILLLTVRNI